MIDTVESSRVEFKVKLIDDLEETVIGFLNSKDGGYYLFTESEMKEFIKEEPLSANLEF